MAKLAESQDSTEKTLHGLHENLEAESAFRAELEMQTRDLQDGEECQRREGGALLAAPMIERAEMETITEETGAEVDWQGEQWQCHRESNEFQRSKSQPGTRSQKEKCIQEKSKDIHVQEENEDIVPREVT